MTTKRLIHGKGQGRTQVQLVGGGELVVMESPRDVLAQLDANWAVLEQDNGNEAHVRSSSVAAIIDLDGYAEGHLRPVS